MELVEDLSEILDNLLYLESKLNSKNPQDCEEANNLIKKGICFVKYVIDNRIVFAPSRFIGYKNQIMKFQIKSILNFVVLMEFFLIKKVHLEQKENIGI